MSKRMPYGNIRMKGKRFIKNPCPCCDTIENKKKRVPRGLAPEKKLESEKGW